MNTTKIGFIGCGNMGGALLGAVAKSPVKKELFVCDANGERAKQAAEAAGAKVLSALDLAQTCDVIFLGVKPQGLEALFGTIRPAFADREPLLISMAAGISLAAIGRMAGKDLPVIRIMPNTPASVGEGMILYAPGKTVSEDAVGSFLSMMKEAGVLDRIPEEKIDAASALSGCGPAFVYLFAEALADGAVECGLSREAANLYAAQTIIGAGKMLRDTGKNPGALKDAVCSPGGTTIAGVHALEEGAFRASVMDAVTAAYEKTLKLKK